MLPTISVTEARRLLADGAMLVDIREPDEHARERIAGARNAALSRLGPGLVVEGATKVIFHCKSGNRTAANAATLRNSVACDAYILEGGIESWKAGGLPVVIDATKPIEIMRQVQILAGSLVLTGVLLGQFLHPAFAGLAGFVGAGLVFAGVSGWCGMAKLLAVLPWNRRAA